MLLVHIEQSVKSKASYHATHPPLVEKNVHIVHACGQVHRHSERASSSCYQGGTPSSLGILAAHTAAFSVCSLSDGHANDPACRFHPKSVSCTQARFGGSATRWRSRPQPTPRPANRGAPHAILLLGVKVLPPLKPHWLNCQIFTIL